MKEVDIISIDNRDFIVNKVIKNFYYCSNLKDLKDCCILKEVNGEYLPLSNEELNEAITLYKQDE